MDVVFQLVQYFNFEITLEWPFEVVIKLSSHQVGRDNHTIGRHSETHLVPSWVGEEWWGVPVIACLVLLKVYHGQFSWKYPRL